MNPGISQNMGSTVTSFLQANSFTGYPTLDATLLTFLIPFVLGLIKGGTDICQTFITVFFQFIFNFVVNKFKNRLIGGDILADIYLDNKSDVYRFIKQYIFDTKYPSDIDINALHQIIGEDDYQSMSKHNKNVIIEPSALEKNIFFRYLSVSTDYDKKMDLNLNYDSDDKHILKDTDCMNRETNTITKLFRYKTYIIKIILRSWQTNGGTMSYSLKLTLISTKEKFVKELKSFYVEMIEEFFNNRFKMNENIDYVYKITISGQITQKLKNFVDKTYLDGSLGTTKFSDPYESSPIYSGKNSLTENDTINTNDLTSIFKIENMTDIKKDYTQNIDFCASDNSQTYKSNNVFYYYNKYVGQLNGGSECLGIYFIKNTNMYLLTKMNGTWLFTIISHGKLLTKSMLKLELDQFIKIVLSADIAPGQAKSDISLFKRTTNNQWKAYTIDQRNFDTIFLPSDTMKEIRNEIDMFVAKEKLYRTYQIPYKKGILFYGPPGTGKTSLVKSLAYEYQFHIYMINVNDEDINDDTICDILNSIGGGGNKILLFEDIDTAFADKELIKGNNKSDTTSMTNDIKSMLTTISNNTISKVSTSEKLPNENEKEKEKEKYNDTINTELLSNMVNNMNKTRKYLTYSGLLNALDGVLSNQQGVITIMTTNYRERLGDAFLRPGRIDRQFELKECNDEQIIDMATKFIQRRVALLNKTNEKEYYTDEYLKTKTMEMANKLVNIHRISSIKPCELQYYLLRYIDVPDDIFTHAHELSKSTSN